jgi:hypothetical protein
MHNVQSKTAKTNKQTNKQTKKQLNFDVSLVMAVPFILSTPLFRRESRRKRFFY